MYYNSNDNIAANLEGMDDSIRNLCRNPNLKCRREIILNYFNFSLNRDSQPFHLCCDICRKMCNCDICLMSDLHDSLTEVHVTCNEVETPVDESHHVAPLISARQKEKIRKRLVEYKQTLGKASRFGLGPATGFSEDLIDMVCQNAELLVSREAVQQYLPVWKDSHTDTIFGIIQEARELHF